MPDATNLNPVAIFFAAGTADLNRAALDVFAAARPSLALVVVSEFEPHRGEWIPFHVRRSRADTVAAIRASLGTRTIAQAALVLARGTALRTMRFAALQVTRGSLFFYDEELRVVRWSQFGSYGRRQMARELQTQFARDGRARQWLHRLGHPSEAEIPVRARLAQAYGAAAARFRSRGKELPLGGYEPLRSGVSVVIPSRDGRSLLEEMLPHLAPQVDHGEIIVIDNGSSDGTRNWITQAYPAIRVIVSETPLSFARAINAGVTEARFDRLLMLNNDMIAAPHFVRELQSAFDLVPDLFCATAQIFFPPGVRREETGKAVWRKENPLDFPVRCDEPIEGEDLTWVLYGSGGCSMFDTQRLRALGGVSEVYEPAYVEDMDFGYRAWKRGWPTVYRAGARVEHRHRATTSRFFTSRQIDFFVERNYLRFLIHAVGSAAMFRSMWMEAIRRLQLRAMQGDDAALDALRDVPHIGPMPGTAEGLLSEEEILALGNGDIAAFPGSVTSGNVRSRIVIASPYLPFPLSHGGAVRIYNLMREAAREYGLVLVAFCDEFATPPSELLALCREVVLVRRHGTHYRKDTRRPDMVEEFDSLAFRACLRQTCARWKPAILQLEFTWMAQYADVSKNAQIILVEHDITFDLQRQLLTAAPSWELQQQLVKWERFEKVAWKQVDCVVTMSAKDRAAVDGAKRSIEIPNGVDCDRFQPQPFAPEPRRLLFIGSFAHLPNLLALEFFLREVWPSLPRGFTLHIIAGARHEYYLDLFRERVRLDLDTPGIETEGFVSDVRLAYTRAEIVIAPLIASAGTNIKVLEAMAMGKVVVSTPAGVNGIPVTAGKNAVVFADPSSIASAILSLSGNPAERAVIELAARQFALQFDWKQVGIAQSRLYRFLVL